MGTRLLRVRSSPTPAPKGPSRRRLVALVVGGAAILGLMLAILKGRDGGLGYYLGNLSAPYLIAPYLAGAQVNRRWIAVLVGVAATWTTLLGFYIGAESVFGYLSSTMSRFYVEWFTAGVVSGIVLGAAGHGSRSQGHLRYIFPIALLGEPVAVSLVRLTGRFGGTQLSVLQLDAWGIEILLGGLALLMTFRNQKLSRRGHRDV